jgi:hypothetical protein
VSNNPVRYNDPTGHKACDDIGNNGNCLTENDLTKIYEKLPKIVSLGTQGRNDKKYGIPILENYYAGCNYISCTVVTIYPLNGEADSNRIGVFWTSSKGNSPITLIPSYLQNQLMNILNSVTK